MMIPTESASPTTVPIHPDTRIGHVHYTVADLDRQIGFYRDILGFKVHWHAGNSVDLETGGEDLLRLTQVMGGTNRAWDDRLVSYRVPCAYKMGFGTLVTATHPNQYARAWV